MGEITLADKKKNNGILSPCSTIYINKQESGEKSFWTPVNHKKQQ